MNDDENRTSIEERLGYISKMMEANPEIPTRDWLSAFGVVEMKWCVKNKIPLSRLKKLLKDKTDTFINSYEGIRNEEKREHGI